jgi:hypothetical protein
MTDLRTHLQDVIAGKAPSNRGHGVTAQAVADAAALSRACNALFTHAPSMFDDEDEGGAMLTPPAELLIPLP